MKRLLLLSIFGLQGCVYMTAAQSTAGRAFVIRNEIAGSSYWNCYANNGDPVCYQVTKVPQSAPLATLDSQPKEAPKQIEVAKAAPVEVEKKKKPVVVAAAPAPTTKKNAKPAATPPDAVPAGRKPLTINGAE